MDSAAGSTGAALVDGEVVLAGLERPGAAAAEGLDAWIRELLAHAELTVDQLTGVLVGAGPGSFTGIRTTLAFALGLAFGGRLPIWTVSSLTLLAARSPGSASLTAVSDAGRGQVYFAVWGDGWTAALQPQVGMVAAEKLGAAIGPQSLVVGLLRAPVRELVAAGLSATQSMLDLRGLDSFGTGALKLVSQGLEPERGLSYHEVTPMYHWEFSRGGVEPLSRRDR